MKIKLVQIKIQEHWEVFHEICKKEIFEKASVQYDEKHPSFSDERFSHFLLIIGSSPGGAVKIELLDRGSEAILRIIALKEEFQNKGIGKVALQKIENFLSSKGVLKLYLNSDPEVAMFYEKCGYIKTPFKDDTVFVDSIQYCKEISDISKIELKSKSESYSYVRLVDDVETHFLNIKNKAFFLAKNIEGSKKEITNLLIEYESYHVIQDELAKSIECLVTIDSLKSYFNIQVKSTSSLLPVNLPLYSLVLFSIIPSFQSDYLCTKPSQKFYKFFPALVEILNLKAILKNIDFFYGSRAEFRCKYTSAADVIIYTGNFENALKLKNSCRKDALFISNGNGHNPLVITENANILEAAKKVCYVKTFNSGQDCASPDCIMVQEEISENFIYELTKCLASIKVGSYHDKEVTVGALSDDKVLLFISELFLEHKNNIVIGGRIDYAKSIVEPTIIKYKASERLNFKEIYAPVFFIVTYKDVDDLRLYFESPQYAKNAMYISLFGDSHYILSLKNSIVLREKIIHEVEKGNLEYGGYSKGASFVSINEKIKSHPILIPREIQSYISS
jgi:GNAT superfamily N-acetyltransferase